MTPTEKKEQAFNFLVAKIELITAHMSPQRKHNLRRFGEARSMLSQIPLESLRIMDRELQSDIDDYLTAEQLATVNEQLLARFGKCHLGMAPRKIIEGVLRRGKIKTGTEAMIVRDFLSGPVPEIGGGEKRAEFERLDYIYGTYERTLGAKQEARAKAGDQ